MLISRNVFIKVLTGALITFSTDGFLNFVLPRNNRIFENNGQFCELHSAFLKIEGFPGTHGTPSKGAPAEG